MKRWDLNRVVTHAVQYALISGLSACAARALTTSGENTRTDQDATPDNTGGTTADGGASKPRVEGVPLECSDDSTSIFDHMQLASSYDSIGLRMIYETGLDEPPVESALSGAHCSGAADVDTCSTLVDNTWPTPDSAWRRCDDLGCRSFGVLTTQGDDVALAESLDAISALLGPIDTPHEASLWAQPNDYDASCDGTSYRSTASGIVLDFEQMISDCPVTYAEISLHVAPDGTLKELSRVELPDTGVCIGRRPPGLLGVNAQCSGFQVGDYFAEVAALENAAVEAFDVIRSDLTRLGAPETLLREAERAQADEVRHAQQMSALAVRYGATPAKHRSEPRSDQALLEFALDNAVEGCIRETFGAACAAYQVVRARDPEVRATLREIATDETRHAELSWKIHSWAESQLNAAERAQLAAAMHAAVAQLHVEVTRAQPASVRFIAGVPNPADAAALLDDLQAQLWAPALAA